MKTLSVVAVCAAFTLAACTTGSEIRVGADGRPLPQIYRISSQQEAKIPFHLLDSVNALRAAKGATPLQYNAQLNAAAATHSRDMSVQNRPWHFGSDGSSPLDRVNRVGYTGRLVGENISETFQTELETLSAWMSKADTREVIMDPQAREIGFAWFQEPSGKIWWTMVTGA
ncbi:CAP domain-containing protein [Pseudorhodobacter sp.]|uniref:CAP domain-containing protein n=1 Tax=Pseudorhodobacter sp. TaxID=1934400 RepID=UPI002AFEA4A8|nr:CAP domain-containing protein [Pseudorhodobacter sp.]